MLLLCNPQVIASGSFAKGPRVEQVKAGADFAAAAGGAWENFKRIKQGETSLQDSSDNNAESKPPPTLRPSQVQSEQPAPTESAILVKRRKDVTTRPNQKLITAPVESTETGASWKFYAGTMAIASNAYYDPHRIAFKWSYSRKDPLPKNPRVIVHMHESGGGEGAMQVFSPSHLGDIEVRTQDAEAYNQDWREWWTFGGDGTPYPGRRIAAALQFLSTRYWIDMSVAGIVLQGPSMGGTGAVIQTMILPSPWRQYITYSSARAGAIMPRQIARRDPAQYATLPPDNAENRTLWDSIDFEVQSAIDPVVRGIHYRNAFSSDDPGSAGVDNTSTQLLFVNLVEQRKIGGAFGWVKAGHGTFEQGVRIPDMSEFESADQDVSLDRAHPAITNSTGNYPLLAADRIDNVKFPRGHYNMGITWDHAHIIDDSSQIVFPLKYTRRVDIGKDVPDQPTQITISVTPRRARNFQIRDGETLFWTWDGGVLSGSAQVSGDTVTVEAIPLVSGENYKKLRLYR
jgi:hypothetical protein